MKSDLFQHPDYYSLDDLLTEEHLLIRDAARQWVKKEVSPIIDEHYEKATFPTHLLSGLGEIGLAHLGPIYPLNTEVLGLIKFPMGLLCKNSSVAIRACALRLRFKVLW